MKSIGVVKGGPVPKQIKIVNKNKTLGSTGSLEPVMEVKESAKTNITAAESGDRTANKNGQTTVF